MRFRESRRSEHTHAFDQKIYNSRCFSERCFESAEWPIRNVGKSFTARIAAVTLAATIKETKIFTLRFTVRTDHIHQPPVGIIHEPSSFYSGQGNFISTGSSARKILTRG
jgi:hypothetical protein